MTRSGGARHTATSFVGDYLLPMKRSICLLVALCALLPTTGLAQAPRLLPTPQELQFDPRTLTLTQVHIASDGQPGNQEVAALLARRLRSLLQQEVRVAVPEEDLEPGVSLLVIGDPRRIKWLNGVDELWAMAPPQVRNNPDGYYLIAAPSGDRNFIVILSRSARGAFYGAQSLLQLLEANDGKVTVPRVNVADWPSFKNRGIIEGFYGTPWTWPQREAMIEFAGRNKMNWFILAPKEAPWHRSHWQQPHTADELQWLQRLNRTAQARHVNFCYAIAPGRSMNYVNPTDLELLLRKIASVQNLGIRNFALLMDDIPFKLRSQAERKRFRSIEDAHIYVAIRFYRAVKNRDPGAQMFFCPTRYHGKRPHESSYVRSLGQRLPREVQIFWTGPGVVSMTLNEPDSDVVAKALRRPAFYWDNFPVNDYDRTRFFLGPLAQRAPLLHAHCAGLVANPMNEAEASKLPLMTVADYLWNPMAYAPQRSWDTAVMRLTDPQLAPSLRVIARLSAPNRFWRQDGLNLSDRITSFWQAMDRPENEDEVRALRTTFLELRDHARTLASPPRPTPFTTELARLIGQTESLSVLGSEAIEVARATRRAEGDYQARARVLRQRVLATEREHTVEGIVSCPALDAMRQFVRECVSLTPNGRVLRGSLPAAAANGVSK